MTEFTRGFQYEFICPECRKEFRALGGDGRDWNPSDPGNYLFEMFVSHANTQHGIEIREAVRIFTETGLTRLFPENDMHPMMRGGDAT